MVLAGAMDLAWGLALVPGSGLAGTSAPTSALVGAPARVGGAALGPGLKLRLAALANSARAFRSRAARPAGSPWLAISQWRASRRRPSRRVTMAIELVVVLAGPGGGCGCQLQGERELAGARSAVAKGG